MSEIKKRVLIVEDERMIAKPLGMKLEISGFEIANAYDGDEALAIMEKEKFDIVLLDLMMPKTDGFAVLTELKRRDDPTPVIIASNLNQINDISRALELGVANYYVKSDVTLDEIIAKIKDVLKIA
jgi:DNA-binding response OmpR family regulator